MLQFFIIWRQATNRKYSSNEAKDFIITIVENNIKEYFDQLDNTDGKIPLFINGSVTIERAVFNSISEDKRSFDFSPQIVFKGNVMKSHLSTHNYEELENLFNQLASHVKEVITDCVDVYVGCMDKIWHLQDDEK